MARSESPNWTTAESERTRARTYECSSCGATFESVGTLEGLSCTDCGKRDFREV